MTNRDPAAPQIPGWYSLKRTDKVKAGDRGVNLSAEAMGHTTISNGWIVKHLYEQKGMTVRQLFGSPENDWFAYREDDTFRWNNSGYTPHATAAPLPLP